MWHDNVAVSCPHDRGWSHQKYRCEQPFKVSFFNISVIKQSVLNSVAVARKSHLKKGDKPQKNTEGNSIISHGLKRFSAFSLLSFLPVFICFKKDIRLRKEKQETQKENKITWSNVRSITQSLPVEEFFSCFFLFMQKDFADSESSESSPEHSLSLRILSPLPIVLPAVRRGPSCCRTRPRPHGAKWRRRWQTWGPRPCPAARRGLCWTPTCRRPPPWSRPRHKDCQRTSAADLKKGRERGRVDKTFHDTWQNVKKLSHQKS